jgi:hypothetical protein
MIKLLRVLTKLKIQKMRVTKGMTKTFKGKGRKRTKKRNIFKKGTT